MTQRAINTNIAGRVKKIRTDNFLVPVFEIISNSIHAIEAQGIGNGSIAVEIYRHPRQLDLEEPTGENERPITAVVVTDNGVGFTEPNMFSFCEADSTLKASMGGKGIGRFVWLKFFDGASIESVFQDGEKRRRRTFTFSTAGVDESELVDVTADIRTVVTLDPLKVTYETKTRKSLDHVAIAIIEHFIVYLVTHSLPRLVLRDGAAEKDIGAFYTGSIGQHESTKTFTINDIEFKVTGIKFYLGGQTHAAFLCGDKRAADKIVLGKKDPFFAKRFVDSDLRHYSYLLFVESKYLDSIVNDDREGFHFPEIGSLGAIGGVAREQIIEEVLRVAREDMATEITKLREGNLKTVTSFVNQTAPQYRYIVNKHQEAVTVIHETDPAKLDLALRKLQFEEELKTREEIASLLRGAEVVGGSSRDEWRKKSAEVFTRLNDEGKANLASYIVRRRLILDLLRKRMEIRDGQHSREEAIHQLIFPMRQTSDDVSYEDQNLWIIDERLSYHYYLASDKPLKKIPPASVSDSTREPDIIVFDRPIALNDRPEHEQLESIVIIEFKRPCITPVDGEKNPVEQVQEYIELILEGRAKSRTDRPLTATRSTYFFGYVVCELDPQLKKVLARKTMRETPDGRGMFGFFPDHRAYIEVISYAKMLDDAQKRNRVLFEKLQLPSQRIL